MKVIVQACRLKMILFIFNDSHLSITVTNNSTQKKKYASYETEQEWPGHKLENDTSTKLYLN